MLPLTRKNFWVEPKERSSFLRRVPFGGILENRFAFFSCRHDPKLPSPDVRSKSACLSFACKLTQEHSMVEFAHRPLSNLFRFPQRRSLRQRGVGWLLARKVTVGVHDLC